MSEYHSESTEVGDRRIGTVTPPRDAKREEFTKFYLSDMPSLVKFTMFIGASFDDAKEIAQEAMVAAFQRWDQINHPQAWVRTVASRELSKQWKDAALRGATGLDPVASDDPSVLAPSAEDNVLLSEQRHDVLRALGQLPQSQRTIMAWHLDGSTTAEIAEHLKTTEPTVRSQLRHARRRMAALLERRLADETELR